MIKKIAAVAGITIILAGCSFERPTASAFTDPYPPAFYATQVPAAFENILKDPDSAKFRYGTARKAYMNNGLAYGGKVVWTGYALPVEVNAKNSYGGYTGYKPYIVLFNSQAVSRILDDVNTPLFHWADDN